MELFLVTMQFVGLYCYYNGGPVIGVSPTNLGKFFVTAVLEKATEQLLLSFFFCESKSICFKSTEKSRRIVRYVYRSSANI